MSSVILPMPSTPVRYHLLLGRGGEETDFRELVAATDVVVPADGWWGTVDSALDVSSVEADARLARWSRHTGGLAVRLSRPDPTRWWLAVHHAGQRLFAMIHTHEPPATRPVASPWPGPDGFSGGVILTDAALGQDPLADLSDSAGGPRSVRRAVARARAAQLAGALLAGGVHLDEARLEEILVEEAPADGNLRALLDELGAGPMYDLAARAPAEDLAGLGMPPSIQGALGRAVLLGCALPVLLSTVVFVTAARMAARAGLGPAGALLLGGGAAWLALALVRRALGQRLRRGAHQAQTDHLLLWASDPEQPQSPVRPTASALNTWGGLFYLLRDIAFFAGIDRPKGPMSLYLESLHLGPPGLVTAINRVEAEERSPDPLYDAAQALVELRDELIRDHLDKRPVAPEEIARSVRDILRPAVTDLRPSVTN